MCVSFAQHNRFVPLSSSLRVDLHNALLYSLYKHSTRSHMKHIILLLVKVRHNKIITIQPIAWKSNHRLTIRDIDKQLHVSMLDIY